MSRKNLAKVFALVAMVGTCAAMATSCNKVKDPYADESVLIDLTKRDVTCENGCVAAANPYAAHCGLQVLMNGGNAFDAAVAVSFALGLTEPHCSSVGGGGILVGYNAKEGEFVSYNFREFVPAAGKASAYANAEEMDEGVRASGVPTQVQSLLGVLDDAGNFKNNEKGRKAVIGPAADLAKNGFIVTKELAEAISAQPEAWLTDDTHAGHILSDEGMAKAEGDVIINEDLSKVYNEIISKGADGFYKGWVAEAIIESQQEHLSSAGNPGLITQADLDYARENYPKKVNPVQGTYSAKGKKYDIVSSTCPSSGGIILLESLNMIEHYKSLNGEDSLDTLGHNSAEYINLMSTVTQLAYGDKQKYIGDNSINPATGTSYTNVPITGLLSKEYAAVRLDDNYKVGQQFNGKYSQKTTTANGSTVASQNYGNPRMYSTNAAERVEGQYVYGQEETGGTTSFSCADKWGNIVTITQTINHFFGSKFMPEGCGFYLNNQMSSFTTTPTSASYVEPYKHPTSHIMPTIILNDGEAVATLGSPGSMRLVSAVFETVVNMLDFGMDIQSAIEAPRYYSYCVSSSDNGSGEGTGDESHKALFVEQCGDISASTVTSLKNMGYALNVYNEQDKFFGGVQGITFENGQMHGGADIRRDGKALGY